MGSETVGSHAYDLPEMLHTSGLSAKLQRDVYEAIVSSVIEGDRPGRESVVRLIEFAAGRIDWDEYRRQVLGVRSDENWTVSEPRTSDYAE